MQDARHANVSDHHSWHGTVLVRGVQLINGSSHRQNISIRDICVMVWLYLSAVLLQRIFYLPWSLLPAFTAVRGGWKMGMD
jgi:hypothetical protein